MIYLLVFYNACTSYNFKRFIKWKVCFCMCACEQKGDKGDQGRVGIAGMPGLPGTPVSITLNHDACGWNIT